MPAITIPPKPRTAPRPTDEAARLGALRRYAILDTPGEPAFDDITRLAAHICRAPIARIIFIDERRQWMKSEVGVRLCESPRDESICAHAILEPRLSIFPDLAKDARFATHPRVAGKPHLRFYAAAPLRTGDGHALGTVCVLDYRPRRLSREQKEALEALARQVMTQLELRRSRMADATATRKAQTALQRKARELHLIADVMPALIAHIDSEQRYLFANRTYEQWCGKSRAEILGATVRDVVGESSYAGLRPYIEGVLSGQPVSFDRPAVYPDGLARHVHGDYLPDVDEHGVVRGFFALVADISESHRIEETLARREHELRLIADSLPVLIAYIDRERRYRFVNRTYELWFGVKREQVYGKTVREVIGEPAFASVSREVDLVLAGQSVAFERWVPYALGPARWIKVDYIPDIAANGVVRGYFALVLDISERIQAESRVRAQYAVSQILATSSNARSASFEVLQAIARHMQWDFGAVWLWNEAEGVLRCRDLWCADRDTLAEFEKTCLATSLAPGVGAPGRVFARAAPMWFSDICQEDNFPRAAAARRCGLHAAFAFPVIVNGKVEAVIEFFSRAIRELDQGLLQTAEAIARDVAHFILRRRAELEIKSLNADLEHRVTELQALMDVAPVGIAVARDADCDVITSNRAFTELLGMDADSNVSLNRPQPPYRVFKGGVECPARDLPMQLAAQRREKVESVELEVLRADGKRVHVLVNAAPLFDGEGAVRGVISSQIDISERKRAEANLARHTLQLEKVVDERTAQLRELSAHLQSVREDEKAHIAREVHDELGGVLTGLKMDVSWLHRKLTAAKPEIQNKIATLLQLIDTAIAAVRKIQSDLRPALLDDLGLISALEWQAQEFAGRSDIPCQFHAKVGNSEFAPAHAIALFRGFQEALTNVARHAKASQVTASLARDSGNIVLEISDDGVGMESVRLDDISRHGIRGMQERVFYLGGAVSVDSKPGCGTKVTIRLPDSSQDQG
ncbi:MAG: PAS domain-containing protein [Burkholderiales bacterium]